MCKTDPMVRLFTAIDPSTAQRNRLTAYSAWVRERADNGRFVPAENLHFTLHFLGEVPAELVPGLASALTVLAARCPDFVLALGKPGYFNRGRGKLLWVGLRTVPNELLSLHAEGLDLLEGLGLKPDRRPLRPHVTLARELRCTLPWPTLLSGWFDAQGAEDDRLEPAGGITLYLSSRLQGCQVYTPLCRARFGAGV